MKSRLQSPQRAANADAEDEPGYTVTFLTARGCLAGTRAQACVSKRHYSALMSPKWQ